MIMDHIPRASTSCPASYDVKTGYIAHGLSPSLVALWRQSQQLITPHGEQGMHAMSGEIGCDPFPVFMARSAAGAPYHQLPQLNEYRAASSTSNSAHSFSPNNIMRSQVVSKAINDRRMLVNDANSQYIVEGQYDVKAPTVQAHIQNILRSESPFFEDELMADGHNPYPGPLPESFRELLLQECSKGPDFGCAHEPNSENPSQGQLGTLVMAEMQQYYQAALEGMSNHSCEGALNQALPDAKRVKDGCEQTNNNLLQLAARAVAAVSKDYKRLDHQASCAAASDKFKGYDYIGGDANQGINEDGQLVNVKGGIDSNNMIVGRNQRNMQGGAAEERSKNTAMVQQFEQHFKVAAEKSRFGAGSSSNVICFGQGGAAAEEDDGQEVLNIGELQDAFVLVELQRDQPSTAAAQALQYAVKRRASNTLTLQQLAGSVQVSRPKKASRHPLGPALNTNLKPRARQGNANDPQSIAARQRRERINSRLKTLQELVPNGSKVDLVTMLEKAINYVKFLQLQLKVLTDDEFWSNAQQLLGQEGSTSLLGKGLLVTEGNSSLESSNVFSK